MKYQENTSIRYTYDLEHIIPFSNWVNKEPAPAMENPRWDLKITEMLM